MRYSTMAVILTGLLSIGFTANPASAHCHASIEDARARLAMYKGSAKSGSGKKNKKSHKEQRK